ncbi:MAG: DUF2520 domain-containing protein [Bacteroidales bacterium]|nr:DUF2520 domain-containing protein [Bacteroidales bacterium]
MKVACNGKKFTLANLAKRNKENMQICLIGAGNLAAQLAPALAAKGHRFLQVYSRTESSAAPLACILGCEAVVQPERIRPDADLYLSALNDDDRPQVLAGIHFGKGLLVHTAGSLPMDVLIEYTSNVGVFYPLQTFSKQRQVDFSKVPFFIEATFPESLEILNTMASSLSNKVVPANSDQRKQMHLAAVFANNFVNYLYGIAEDIAHEKGLDFQYLLPLIEETASKVQTLAPVRAQTGPAVRFDRAVMDKHLELLQDHPDWLHLYKTLSQGIYERTKK